MKLNTQQEKAVTYRDGYAFVSSVPGSGKTSVLTARATKLIADGVNPKRILCITFTNKAAKEMKERIHAKFQDVSTLDEMHIRTFHSLAAYILRKEASFLEHHDSKFTIISPKDQEVVIKKAAEDMGLKVKTRGKAYGVDLYECISKISYKKDTLQGDAEFLEEVDETMAHIYNYYTEYLRKANCMDFGDLLYLLHDLLSKNEEVRDHYANLYKYIMVDECQDLNVCQYEIAKLLASKHHNLVLIGDPDQSIYRFRQADPKNLRKYLKEKNVDLLPLSSNYRSTKKILRAAHSLIKNNPDRIDDGLETVNDEGEHVKVVSCEQYTGEPEFISREIRRLKNKYHYNWSDFCILYRMNALSRGIEQVLRMDRVPCHVVGGRSFFDYRVVKACIGYLNFYSNPHNTLDFNTIINQPRRSIDEGIMAEIENYCFKHKIDVIDALENIDEINITKIGPKRKAALMQFHRALKKKPEDKALKTSELAERIFKDSGFEEFVMNDVPTNAKKDSSTPAQVYDSFLTMIREWEVKGRGGLQQFLEFVSLCSSDDVSEDYDAVNLMTMHSSKGLEFPVVFVINVEEEYVPHKLCLTGDPEDLEEERRLFYVAITRAEEHLYVTFSKTRMIYGKTERRIPSRFLKEMIVPDTVQLIKC